MVIIKVNPLVRLRDMMAIEESIRRQAETGVIILPQHCELLNEVPADEEIKVIRQDDRATPNGQRPENKERCKFCAGVAYTDKPFKVITQTAAVVDAVFNYCPVCGAKLNDMEA